MHASTILKTAAILEAATGLALIVDPAVIAVLLFGGGLSGPAIALGRVAGFGLLSLGVACWPGRNANGSAPALRAMLTYNSLVTLYLIFLGVDGQWAGRLLWPAVLVHSVLTLLFVRASSKQQD